jgi:hypothetical protein
MLVEQLELYFAYHRDNLYFFCACSRVRPPSAPSLHDYTAAADRPKASQPGEGKASQPGEDKIEYKK